MVSDLESGAVAFARAALAAELGDRVHVLPCDLSDSAAVDALPKQAATAMGAGIGRRKTTIPSDRPPHRLLENREDPVRRPQPKILQESEFFRSSRRFVPCWSMKVG